MANKGVTLGIILEHVQGLEVRINKRFDRLEAKVDRNHFSLTNQIDAIDERLDDIEVKHLPRLEHQIGMIDKRLDNIEIEQLPKRVTRIEKHLGLSV